MSDRFTSRRNTREVYSRTPRSFQLVT